MCFSTIAHTSDKVVQEGPFFTGVLLFTKDDPSESVVCQVCSPSSAALWKWRLLVGSWAWADQFKCIWVMDDAAWALILSRTATLRRTPGYTAALFIYHPAFQCWPAALSCRRWLKEWDQGHERTMQVFWGGVQPPRGWVEVRRMGPASPGGSSVSAGRLLSDISPLETFWAHTDIEFIRGTIFISPPLGEPGYPPGRAGQYHPCGNRMCNAASACWSQRGGGN